MSGAVLYNNLRLTSTATPHSNHPNPFQFPQFTMWMKGIGITPHTQPKFNTFTAIVWGACYTESLRRQAETEHGLAFKKYWITVEACIKQTETECTNEPWHFILLFLLLYAEANQHHRAFNNNIRLQSTYLFLLFIFLLFFLIVLLLLPCLFTHKTVMFYY